MSNLKEYKQVEKLIYANDAKLRKRLEKLRQKSANAKVDLHRVQTDKVALRVVIFKQFKRLLLCFSHDSLEMFKARDWLERGLKLSKLSHKFTKITKNTDFG